MYLDFFNLREFPFSIACDERFFYESNIHTEALCNMVYAVGQRKGMVLISGQVGAGKTFLAGMLASRLGLGALVVPIKHPPASAKQLLRAMGAGLGLKLPRDMDITATAEEVEQSLQQYHRRNRLVTLLIDEVQDLPDDALEEVRLIWNWELDSQRLAQIVLVGQPEIRKRLVQPRWESLRQRIVLSYHLGCLSAEETADYIRHRISVATNGDAGDNRPRFPAEALEAIHQATHGTPRLVNSLCDNALLTAYASGTREITTQIVDTVLLNMTFWAAEMGPADDPPADEDSGSSSAKPTKQQPIPAEAPRQAEAPPDDAVGGTPAKTEASPGDAVDGTVDCPPEAPPAEAEATTDNSDYSDDSDDSDDSSSEVLRAALLGDPSAEMARKVYRRAPEDSEAHHLAIRILAQGLLARVSPER